MRTTINDVAKDAGVSIKTVSRVINNETSVRDNTREKVMASVKKLNFQPNLAARSLAGTKAYSIAYIYDNPNAYYIIDMQNGILDACKKQGFELLIHPCDAKEAHIFDEITNMITSFSFAPTASASEQQSKGGGCLIATAAFGSEMAPQVQFLRELRDNTVLQTESGTSFMTGFNQFYYSFSPAIADYERENPTFKEAVKLTLTPLLISLSLLQYADIDSESEMLGYGIGVILLNIGMYFVAPAVLIMKVRKRI